MTSKIYWINEDRIGRFLIGSMARPRGNDWLEDQIKGLKLNKVDCLVSLLEKSEERELGLELESQTCGGLGIEFINHPIRDVDLPDSKDDFIKLVNSLTDRISQEKKVVIHCRMGIGRSSMLIAAIMLRLGYKGREVFDIIGKHRQLEVPDTEEQKNWILSIENDIKR